MIFYIYAYMRNGIAPDLKEKKIALLCFLNADLIAILVHIGRRARHFFIVYFFIQQAGKAAAVYAAFLAAAILVRHAIPVVNKAIQLILLYLLAGYAQLLLPVAGIAGGGR